MFFKVLVPCFCALAVAGTPSACAKKGKVKSEKTLKEKCEAKERKIELLKRLLEAKVQEGKQNIELWIPEKRSNADLTKVTKKELKTISEIRGEVLDLLKKTCKELDINYKSNPEYKAPAKKHSGKTIEK